MLHLKLKKLIWCWCTFSWSCAVTSPPCPPGPPGGGLKPEKKKFSDWIVEWLKVSLCKKVSLHLSGFSLSSTNQLKTLFPNFESSTFRRKGEGERMKAWDCFQHSNYQAAYFNILAIYFQTYWEPWLRDPYSQLSSHPRLLQSCTEDWDNFKSCPLDE